MTGRNRRTGKLEAIKRLTKLAGIEPPDGAGGTVTTGWLVTLGDALFGDAHPLTRPTKTSALRRVIELAGGHWSNTFMSSGKTVPGETLWTLVQLLEGSIDMSDIASPEQLEQLAEQIAELSEHDEEYPQGFGATPVPIHSEDIAWTNNRWLTTLADLQGWLHLESHWNPTADVPEATFRLLFEMIGTPAPDVCVVLHEGVVLPSEVGAGFLQDRLNAAIQNRSKFVEALNDGASQKYATNIWADLWEEMDIGQTHEPVSVHAAVDTWKLKDFRDYAEDEQLDLNPSYQRDSVWSNTDSQKLIDSILRGIPLPSIILNKRQGSDLMEIVDGKQRLTAILRFIGRHPDGVKYAEKKFGLDGFRENYRVWRKKHGVKSAEEREQFLPFPLGRYPAEDPLHTLSNKFYFEIRTQKVEVQGQKISISSLFEGSSKDYKIPVILYENTPINQIHKVFGIYNKQGKHLNAEELRNAIFHHLELTRLILVLADDHSMKDISGLLSADVLRSVGQSNIPDIFDTINVSRARFRSSKLVGWLAAIVASSPKKRQNNSYATPSTSSFINRLLETVHESKNHELRKNRGLANLAHDLTSGAELFNQLHVFHEAFSPSFVRKKQGGVPVQDTTNWDELPTIAALAACTFASIAGVSPDKITEQMLQNVLDCTALKDMQPLEKQQTKSQWKYLGHTITSLLTSLGVDVDELSQQLDERYGVSSLNALKMAAGEV